MASLTLATAKEFSESILVRMKDQSDAEFQRLHIRNMVRCIPLLVKNLATGKEADVNAMEIAIYLHDLGKLKGDDSHAKESLAMARETFGTLPPVIEDCILNHGSNDAPTTEEGRLVQIADKLSLLDPELFMLYAAYDKKEAIAWFEKMVKRLGRLIEKAEF